MIYLIQLLQDILYCRIFYCLVLCHILRPFLFILLYIFLFLFLFLLLFFIFWLLLFLVLNLSLLFFIINLLVLFFVLDIPLLYLVLDFLLLYLFLYLLLFSSCIHSCFWPCACLYFSFYTHSSFSLYARSSFFFVSALIFCPEFQALFSPPSILGPGSSLLRKFKQSLLEELWLYVLISSRLLCLFPTLNKLNKSISFCLFLTLNKLNKHKQTFDRTFINSCLLAGNYTIKKFDLNFAGYGCFTIVKFNKSW